MFVAYIDQDNRGCDYTIACGKVLWNLRSNNKSDALLELKKMIIGEYEDGDYEDGYWDEHEIKKAILFEVIDKEEVNIKMWYRQAQDTVDQEKQRQKELEEYAELKRLNQKYQVYRVEKTEEGQS